MSTLLKAVPSLCRADAGAKCLVVRHAVIAVMCALLWSGLLHRTGIASLMRGLHVHWRKSRC